MNLVLGSYRCFEFQAVLSSKIQYLEIRLAKLYTERDCTWALQLSWFLYLDLNCPTGRFRILSAGSRILENRVKLYTNTCYFVLEATFVNQAWSTTSMACSKLLTICATHLCNWRRFWCHSDWVHLWMAAGEHLLEPLAHLPFFEAIWGLHLLLQVTFVFVSDQQFVHVCS